MLKRFTVGIFLLAGLVTLGYAADENQNACKGDPNQWRQLFDGKDLNGWKHVGPGGDTVEDGLIRTHGGMGLLYWTGGKISNCIIRVVFKMRDENDNSGVFIRFPKLGSTDPANDWKLAVDRGYEIQIDDTGKNPDTNPPTFGDPLHVTGSVYTLAPASTVASLPLGQWNAYEITARGNDISVVLNGISVSSLQGGTRSTQGYIGLQNHHAGSRVQFRNIRIKTL